MSTWQERVIEEYEEISDRGQKLFDFIDSDVYEALPAFDRIALAMQLAHMQGYAGILRRRINEFKN